MKKKISFILVILTLSVFPVYGFVIESPKGRAFSRMEKIQKEATLNRLIKNQPFDGQIKSFQYLLDNLHIFLSIAKKISPSFSDHTVRINDKGVYFATASNKRMTGKIELIHSSSNQRIFLGNGGYNLFGNVHIRGKGVVIINYKQDNTSTAQPVIADIKFYSTIDSIAVRAFVHLINVVTPKLIDKKITLFTNTFNDALTELNKNPAELYQEWVKKNLFDSKDMEGFKNRFL